MRGTFSSTQRSLVMRHAASNGNAEFLLPSTSMRPLRRWPPSISRVDTRASGPGLERPEVDDFVGQIDMELPAHFGAATVDQRPDVGGSCAAGVDDEVAVLQRDERLAFGGAFHAGAVHQC